MKFKLLNADKQKTFALIMDAGDEVGACITAFAKQQNLSAAQFTGIGAFSSATLGFFDLSRKDYKRIRITEQTEVLSLIGDISLYQNVPKMHAHVVLGKEDGTAHGGHLLEGITRPTVEIILTESPAYLRREIDPTVAIPLIKLDAPDR
jgi:predicted DNA-binding protein with PD1-like motif